MKRFFRRRDTGGDVPPTLLDRFCAHAPLTGRQSNEVVATIASKFASLYDECNENCTPDPSPVKDSPSMLSRSNQPRLHRYPLIDTRNPDEFRETLVSNFGALGFDL